MKKITTPAIELTSAEVDILREAYSIIKRMDELYEQSSLKQSNFSLYYHLRNLKNTFKEFYDLHFKYEKDKAIFC